MSVLDETIRWPEVTQKSWLRILGASESTVSAWRNGRTEPRAEARRRMAALAEVRRTMEAKAGPEGVLGLLYSRPDVFTGDQIVTVLSRGGTDAVLAYLQALP